MSQSEVLREAVALLSVMDGMDSTMRLAVVDTSAQNGTDWFKVKKWII